MKTISILSALCFIILSCTQSKNSDTDEQGVSSSKTRSINAVKDFEIEPFEDSEEGRLAEYGQSLINETYKYFYEEDGEKIGNHLACKSCHLDGGTKPFAAPYVGLTSVFPTYIGREDKIESLEERVNGCFERSMNGKAIPEDSKEMKAIIAYMAHLSKDVATEERIEGQGMGDFEPPMRKADLEAGQLVYKEKCQSCHMEDGHGLKLPNEESYIYPPLWGPDSYNDGAGMSRILTAAKFIKRNMPLGTTYDNPQLTDEETFDVAAYINSFDRPEKANKELDYPDLSKKPKDTHYPPYDDDISQEQHKYGPFNF